MIYRKTYIKDEEEITAKIVAGADFGKIGISIRDNMIELGPGRDSLYVKKEFRGRGIGKTLCNLAIQYGVMLAGRNNKKVNYFEAMTDNGNDIMMSMLEKSGFKLYQRSQKTTVYRKKDI